MTVARRLYEFKHGREHYPTHPQVCPTAAALRPCSPAPTQPHTISCSPMCSRRAQGHARLWLTTSARAWSRRAQGQERRCLAVRGQPPFGHFLGVLNADLVLATRLELLLLAFALHINPGAPNVLWFAPTEAAGRPLPRTGRRGRGRGICWAMLIVEDQRTRFCFGIARELSPKAAQVAD